MRRVSRAPALLPCLALAVACVAASARAESLYVIEQLVVNVSSTPDATGERIATVKSGDQVEVLERAGDEVHARLASGRDGWIRSGYLSATEPLRVQLAASRAEATRLGAEVSRLEAELSAARAAPRAGAAAAVPPPRGAAPEDEEPAGPPPRPLFADRTDGSPRRLWPWALAAGALSLALGFGLGALVLDRHIRRKYGGLRIY